jgi:hypothetical protein
MFAPIISNFDRWDEEILPLYYFVRVVIKKTIITNINVLMKKCNLIFKIDTAILTKNEGIHLHLLLFFHLSKMYAH